MRRVFLSVNRAVFAGGFNSWAGWSSMSKSRNKFSPEVRKRAVQRVHDNEGRHGSPWQADLAIFASAVTA